MNIVESTATDVASTSKQSEQNAQTPIDNFRVRLMIQCPTCAKTFLTLKGLEQHTLIHADQKPYRCDKCGKYFRFKSNLFEHRSVHTAAMPYVCPFCAKSWRLKGNLKKHLQTHVDSVEELEMVWQPFKRRPGQPPKSKSIILSLIDTRRDVDTQHMNVTTRLTDLHQQLSPSHTVNDSTHREQQPAIVLDTKTLQAVRKSLEVVKLLRLTASETEVDLIMSQLSTANVNTSEVDSINSTGEINSDHDQVNNVNVLESIDKDQIKTYFATPLKKRKQRYATSITLNRLSNSSEQTLDDRLITVDADNIGHLSSAAVLSSSQLSILSSNQNEIVSTNYRLTSPIANTTNVDESSILQQLPVNNDDTAPPKLDNEIDVISSVFSCIPTAPLHQLIESINVTLPPSNPSIQQLPKKRRPRRLCLGSSSDGWVQKIRKNELLPAMDVDYLMAKTSERLVTITSVRLTTRQLIELAGHLAFERYHCSICDLAFYSRFDCDQHSNEYHATAVSMQDQPLFCKICYRVFVCRSSKQQHDSYHQYVQNVIDSNLLPSLHNASILKSPIFYQS